MYLQEGFPYCRPKLTVVAYGDTCDEITRVCNDELNEVCYQGKCECLVDEFVVDTGTNCVYKKAAAEKAKRGSSSKHYAIPFSVILLIGILPTLINNSLN